MLVILYGVWGNHLNACMLMLSTSVSEFLVLYENLPFLFCTERLVYIYNTVA